MIRRLTNPLGLFLLIWGAAVILYLGGMHQGMFPSPLPMTVAMILLNVVTFTLGYLTWTLFRGLTRRRRISRRSPPGGSRAGDGPNAQVHAGHGRGCPGFGDAAGSGDRLAFRHQLRD